MFLIVLKTYSQTNISLFDVTLTNGNPTINFDVEKQFNKYHATILIPYSDSQFVENKETGAKRFFNARIGHFVYSVEESSTTKYRRGIEIIDTKPVFGGIKVIYRSTN